METSYCSSLSHSHGSALECHAVTVSHRHAPWHDLPSADPDIHSECANLFLLVYPIWWLNIYDYMSSKNNKQVWYKPHLYILRCLFAVIVCFFLDVPDLMHCGWSWKGLHSVWGGFTVLVITLYNIHWSWGEKPVWLCIRSSDLSMMHCAQTRALFRPLAALPTEGLWL